MQRLIKWSILFWEHDIQRGEKVGELFEIFQKVQLKNNEITDAKFHCNSTDGSSPTFEESNSEIGPHEALWKDKKKKHCKFHLDQMNGSFF